MSGHPEKKNSKLMTLMEGSLDEIPDDITPSQLHHVCGGVIRALVQSGRLDGLLQRSQGDAFGHSGDCRGHNRRTYNERSRVRQKMIQLQIAVRLLSKRLNRRSRRSRGVQRWLLGVPWNSQSNRLCHRMHGFQPEVRSDHVEKISVHQAKMEKDLD